MRKRDFGRRLREARLELGWSQERLAQALGVSKFTVHRWEKGLHSPSSQAIIERVKKVLGEQVFEARN